MYFSVSSRTQERLLGRGPWNLQSLLTDFVAGVRVASELSRRAQSLPYPWAQGPQSTATGQTEPQASGAGCGGTEPVAWFLPHSAEEVRLPGRPRAGSPKPFAGGTNPDFSQLGDSEGSRGAGGGGGRGGVCRNERGGSRLLETNFTNDFCNN